MARRFCLVFLSSLLVFFSMFIEARNNFSGLRRRPLEAWQHEINGVPVGILERNLALLADKQHFFVVTLETAWLAVAFHPQQPVVAVAYGEYRPLELYSIEQGRLMLVQALSEHGEASQKSVSVSWSNDGNYLAVGNYKQPNAIYQFDAYGQLRFVCDTGRNDCTACVAWDESGTLLCSTNFQEPSYVDSFDKGAGTLLKAESGLIPDRLPLLYGAWGFDGNSDGFCLQSLNGEKFFYECGDFSYGMGVRSLEAVADFNLYRAPQRYRVRIDCPSTPSVDGDSSDAHESIILEEWGVEDPADASAVWGPIGPWLSGVVLPGTGLPVGSLGGADAPLDGSASQVALAAREQARASQQLLAFAQSRQRFLKHTLVLIRGVIKPVGWRVMLGRDGEGNTPLHIGVKHANIYFVLSAIALSPSVVDMQVLLRERNTFFQTPASLSYFYQKSIPGSLIRKIIVALLKIEHPDISIRDVLVACRALIAQHPQTDALVREVDHLIEHLA